MHFHFKICLIYRFYRLYMVAKASIKKNFLSFDNLSFTKTKTKY